MNGNYEKINGDCYKMNGGCHKMNGNGHTNGYHEIRKSYVDAVCQGMKLVWNKKEEGIPMDKFMDTVRNKYEINIASYKDLHRWSIQNKEKFWEEIFKFFNIIHSEPYDQVLPPYKDIVSVDWFRGLKFNYAENILRYRDDHIALICLDDEGREKFVTYAEVYEEVKRYAAAFRKHGLKIGDKVACYMSNREETIFAMLACVSIGVVWGGLVPFYGPKAAASALRIVSPKFFLAVDRFSDNKVEHNILEKLTTVVDGITSIEKVIIVPTKEETLEMDISGIPCSCFLDDFLEPDGGHQSNGVTDIKFEQLPFNHPVSINFTSGTTGVPKGVVHSAGAILALMRDFGLHFSCTRDDVLFSMHPCGWTLWNMFTSTLSLGCTIVLYSGNPCFLSRTYFWDLMAKYKITLNSIVTSTVDKMEKLHYVPDPTCDLSSLRLIMPVGSPVKLNNFNFLKQKVKQDMFVGSLYGTTEIMSCISGFHLNSPAYSGQVQSVTLGLDLRIFDHSGNSVIGQPGEVVICSPVPNFPLCLLNDDNGERMKSTYLSKFPGGWAVNDEGWIDPKTNGLVILGRSDEIFNPQEERFGPNDIYFAIQDVEEVVDSLCVSQNSSKGHQRVVLFLKPSPGFQFTNELVEKVLEKIEHELTEFHVPEVILETKEIPLNANGKKMERLVSKILDTNIIPESNNSRNPECLEFYCNIPELQNY